MPVLKVSPELELFYQVDNFVEPWIEPESVLLLHGCAESGSCGTTGCRISRAASM